MSYWMFDIDIRHDQGTKEYDSDKPKCHLNVHSTAKIVPGNHQGACGSNNCEDNNDVPVVSVEKDDLMTNRWDELEE